MPRLADELAELEQRRMTEALAAAGGVKTRAAKLLGMPIRTFTWKLQRRQTRTAPSHRTHSMDRREGRLDRATSG